MFPLGWRGTIAITVGGLIATCLIYGFWWPYWRIADMDLFMVYEAYLLNDGLPQEFFDHPAHLTIVLLGGWFKLLHALGLLDVIALSSLPSGSDANDAWSAAVHAARILSLLLAVGLILSFAALLRKLIADWRIVAMATALLAFSGGLTMHARIVRPELISAGLMTLALLVLLNAARAPQNLWRPVLVGLAALLAMLAMVNKVQAILLIALFPAVILAFGHRCDPAAGFWRRSRLAYPVALLLVLAAIPLMILAAMLAWSAHGSADQMVFHWARVGGLISFYQPIIAAWVVACVIAYAVLWRISAAETIATLAALFAGAAIGFLSLAIHYHPQDVSVVLNPLDQLLHFASWSNLQLSESRSILSGQLLYSLLDGVWGVVKRRTFVLYSSPRPTIFLEWLVVALLIIRRRHIDRLVFIQVCALMVTVWVFDTAGTLRGLPLQYFLYTDPLVIIAAALLLAHDPTLITHARAFQVGAVILTLHIVISQAEPIKHTIMTKLPTMFCVENMHYTKRVKMLPFCPGVRISR